MGKLFNRGSEGAKKGNREEKIRSGEAFQRWRKRKGGRKKLEVVKLFKERGKKKGGGEK